MKKQIFTFWAMLAMVAISAHVFGQGSTPTVPYEGATHVYTVNGLTDGDEYYFGINNEISVYTHEASADYTIVSGVITPGTPGTVSGSAASLSVTWNVGSGSGPYYVWIYIEDADGCGTYRSLPVTPTDAPADYTVDFTVTALALTGDELTTAAAITGGDWSDPTVADVCPSFVGEDWIAGSISDNTMTDGNTYVYFRVNRYSTEASGWVFTPEGTVATTWEISTDANTWTEYTNNSAQSVASGTNTVYIRATVANATSAQTVALSIDDPEAYDAGGLEVDAETVGIGSGVNVASVTLDPLPTVGTFGDSY
ncbi:MAG TPA: hypothetical protein PLK12_05745 [Prolixibacteraceae bacterium]|nr:hypothetical protein [Prolixibacteraceae bacterium]